MSGIETALCSCILNKSSLVGKADWLVVPVALLLRTLIVSSLGGPRCTRAIWAGIVMALTGVGMMDSLDLLAGVHGLLIAGVCGRSGSSTVKDRWKGHSVFSNWRIWSKTSRKSCARRISSGSSTGTSMRQYWGLRICRMNLLECSSTHQAWLFGNIGWRAEPQLRKVIEPGAR